MRQIYMKELCSISLIIPCYNELRTLELCIERCLSIKNHDVKVELIIVDDCSTDGSYALAQKLANKYPEIMLIKHETNRGKGAALRTGFSYATCQYVGIQDADTEYNPLDYLKMLEPLENNKADVVYGSRYLRQENRRVLYFWHTWMNRTLTFISNMFTNLDISDMETCYKLFRREIIQDIAPRLKEERFGFEPEVTALVAQMGCRMYECAIRYEPRSYEEGKKIGWRDGFRAIYCILHYGAHNAPLPMQLLLYFFIGLTCAMTNIGLFIIFSKMGFNLFSATSSAFIIAAILNYFLCLILLFRHKARWSASGEVIAYIATLCIMGALDYSITSGLVASGFSPYWSKVWAALIGFIGNFCFRKYIVF